MDSDERTADKSTADDASSMTDADSQAERPARNMFELSDEDERAVARAARKRAAIWGFGTGLAMLVIAGLCLVLAILASNSAN